MEMKQQQIEDAIEQGTTEKLHIYKITPRGDYWDITHSDPSGDSTESVHSNCLLTVLYNQDAIQLEPSGNERFDTSVGLTIHSNRFPPVAEYTLGWERRQVEAFAAHFTVQYTTLTIKSPMELTLC